MKKITLLTICCLLTALVLTACDRNIDSRDPVRSLPDKPVTPSGISAVMFDDGITLSWDAAGGNVVRYRVYAAIPTMDPEVQDSTTSTTITLDDLDTDQQYHFQIASVGSQGIEGDRSDTLTAVISALSVSVNDNDIYTNSRDVEMNLDAPFGVNTVRFSESSSFADDPPEMTYGNSRNFRLSSGDGVKTVYAEYFHGDDRITVEIVSDQITLDTEALIDSVTLTPTGIDLDAGDQVSFYVYTSEPGGDATVEFTGYDPIALRDNGEDGDAVAGDGLYSRLWTVPVGLTVDEPVIANFTDPAGNEAPSAESATRLRIISKSPALGGMSEGSSSNSGTDRPESR